MRRRQVLLAGSVALMLFVGLPEAGAGSNVVDGSPPDEHRVKLGAEWNVESPGPGVLAAFGQAWATDHVVDGLTQRKLFVTWARNRDSASAGSITGSAVSEDGGITFGARDSLPNSGLGGARLPDGSLLSVEFLPTQVGGELALQIARSTDLGKTWTKSTAKVLNGNATFTWIRVHRNILQLGDGTLLMPVYGPGKGETPSRSWILQSADRGASWSVRSHINDASGALANTNETTISRTTDGRIVAMMRGNVNKILFQSFSDDEARTWTTPTQIVAPEGAPRGWADPSLSLQPNGMLVLTYGRPDNHVLVSRDGTGRTWDDHLLVFANAPRTTLPSSEHGSSGNTAVVSVAANQSLVIGDSCANIWGCREYGQLHRLWARRIDAVTPGTGKLDLATKAKAGLVKLAGRTIPGRRHFPETRIEGAVDGSSEPFSAAILNRGANLVVELDRAYTLDRIGLMLGYGVPEDADVQLSLDGKTWSAPVVRARASVDYALRYTAIAPAKAKYVRIAPPEGGTLGAITELELYASDVMTFENDPINVAPRGFVNTRYAWTADTIMPSYQSKRRLTLVDLDPEAIATATLPTAPTAAQRLSFGYAGSSYGAGVVIDVPAKDADGNPFVAWRFHLQPDFTAGRFNLRVFDGMTWHSYPKFAPQPLNEVWMPVTIDTTGTTATVSVNGGRVTTGHRWRESSAFTGVTFSSWGPDAASAVNMQHDFDDVAVTPIPE